MNFWEIGEIVNDECLKTPGILADMNIINDLGEA